MISRSRIRQLLQGNAVCQPEQAATVLISWLEGEVTAIGAERRAPFNHCARVTQALRRARQSLNPEQQRNQPPTEGHLP